MFGLASLSKTQSCSLTMNFTMEPPPTVEQMVDAIRKVIGTRREPLNIPASFLLGISYPLLAVEHVLGITFPINPSRIRKLIRSNNIWPEQLRSLGYEYTYTLESAIRDWKHDLPEDFS
jgi:GlcNAc-P-P-Und epimerase